jgi:hypothetical protein
MDAYSGPRWQAARMLSTKSRYAVRKRRELHRGRLNTGGFDDLYL